ncbi:MULTISPECIES: DUF5819 family protein [Streptomyces]|uniref:Uncharacterized protein n=1 Tax=Streptomyces venezuelae TaxID=54571 RepID=A0A5P2AW52_STRVZ|nr:DUF5819 family protein [Streptomyces venezuelae]QES21121.1 hypothetical protein DEJ46_20070 [Streptomyces venezuelae]
MDADVERDIDADVETGVGTGVQRAPTGPADSGIMALSLPYQVVAAVALAVAGVFVCVHLSMVFLHVAPSNTLTKRHGQAVDDWIYPEFEQNWKLFAPNPLQQNVSVEVRAEIVTAGDGRRTTDWIDLTAQDTAAIRHNPLPSHTQQNELRRAVDFYLNSHSDDDRPNGTRGHLSEEYMRRIAMLRLDGLASLEGADVRRVQLRAVTRPVPAPRWSTETNEVTPSYRDFPWWKVTDADRPDGDTRSRTDAVGPSRGEAGR